MPVVRLTDLFIQRLRPADPHVTFYDQGLPNFGIRVGKRSRTFVIMKGTKRKRIGLGRYPAISLKDARQSAKFVLLGGSQHPDDAASDAPLASLALQQFLDAHAAKTRLTTQKQTTRILTKRFLPVFADTPIDRITTNDLTAIIDKIAKTAPVEANAVHAKLNVFLNWCVRRQILAKNPLAIVPKPAPIPRRERVLTDDELAAVLKAALSIANTPYGMITLIIAYLGLRRNEAHSLTWAQISRETITIPKDIAKNHTELVLPNTVNGFIATVPKTGPRLFPDNIHWHSAQKLLHARSNTSGWTLHDLRRTLSTNMSRWELTTIDVTEAILNHTTGSRSLIQRTYDRHARLPQMRRALSAYADKLDALLKAH